MIDTNKSEDRDASGGGGQEAAGEVRADREPAAGFDIASVIATARAVLMQPDVFYRGMAKSGSYVEPVIFVLVMAVALGLILTVFSFFGMGSFGAMAVGVGSVIVMPIFALIGSFIAAAIMFVVWKLMGSSHSYETSYRCVAYASAIYPVAGVLALVPYLGSLVGIVWGTFLMVTASVQVHRLKRRTAYIVFGILAAISIVMNISAERQSRRMQAQIEQFGESFEGIEDMTPEEAGQRLGEFLRGLEEGLEQQQRDNTN